MQRILTLNLLWRLEWLLQEEKMGDIADISILRRTERLCHPILQYYNTY